MKLEDQVCSLSLAKRLKELGVKEESYFYWGDQHINKPHVYSIVQLPIKDPSKFPSRICSAFTVAELGEMLPMMVRGKVVKFHKLGVVDPWIVEYTPVTNDNTKYHTEGATEADARARMLIHLIENKLVTTKETTPND